eukprot:CAMPEP_0175913668 /NCGR_PEP_ID=MMETSP0108-20121206/9385_1 /TAXON_ID=195067 ORGANISM="Goniomonas pacifica, Strain CCMP1869" /NCGR_SAMPLE_ID=MMETSP0108 /ASSEMBLY_ACC=CAM_ASM_000204 /LENGTH=70 /DNA_ID=CAMNT_0017236067 /DNA_START=340 /DNA_END=552 /DNA_ORIENTATION=-
MPVQHWVQGSKRRHPSTDHVAAQQLVRGIAEIDQHNTAVTAQHQVPRMNISMYHAEFMETGDCVQETRGQ